MKNQKLNKKIKRAIEKGHPLFWCFGSYRTYYTGLILRATTRIEENGTMRQGIVFSTTSIDGAKKIMEILNECAIETIGWNEALQKFEDYLRPSRSIWDGKYRFS